MHERSDARISEQILLHYFFTLRSTLETGGATEEGELKILLLGDRNNQYYCTDLIIPGGWVQNYNHE